MMNLHPIISIHHHTPPTTTSTVTVLLLMSKHISTPETLLSTTQVPASIQDNEQRETKDGRDINKSTLPDDECHIFTNRTDTACHAVVNNQWNMRKKFKVINLINQLTSKPLNTLFRGLTEI